MGGIAKKNEYVHYCSEVCFQFDFFLCMCLKSILVIKAAFM